MGTGFIFKARTLFWLSKLDIPKLKLVRQFALEEMQRKEKQELKKIKKGSK